jgi:PAS domain S-box-containing protein
MNDRQEDPVVLLLVGRATEVLPQLGPVAVPVSTVATVDAAWHVIRTQERCVVVARADHTGCDALRLVNRIRAQRSPHAVCILLLAGDASNESLSAAALDSGADECVFSPVSAADLRARLGRLLRQCAQTSIVRSELAFADSEGPVTGAPAVFGSQRVVEGQTEQAAMLENALQIGHIGSWSYDARTDSLQWSDATCRLFGISPSEFRGTLDHFFSFLLPEDLAVVQCSMKSTAANPLHEVQYRIRRPDGAVRWLTERGSVFHDTTGAILARVGVVMDVTEQKLTHERLAESLALTKIASRLARLGAWTIDLPERKLTWSDENCAIHDVPAGYQPTLEEGLNLFAPDDREHVIRLVSACAEEGIPYEFEVPKFTAKGRRIWVRSIGEALRDSTGRIVRLQGAFQDVTERKLAEEALRRQAALLHIAGRVARIGGWAIELPQLRIDWSDEIVDMLEFEAGLQPRGRDLLRLLAVHDRRRLWRAIARCARSRTSFDLEGEIGTRNGRRISVRVIGEAACDADGTVRGVRGAVQDVSERLALAEQLRQAQRLESLGQLTGGVAHDFNNLLTVILGNAEMLSEELAGNEQLLPLAEVMVQAALRGADLTQRLLAFARRQPLEPISLDMNRRVAGMSTILRRTLGDHIVVDFEAAAGLWTALVDPVQLDNTLLNLCLNARDAMPRGGRVSIRTANVHVTDDGASHPGALKPGAYVMLSVQDTGAGIAPEHLPHVFEPFFTTKDKDKGTGLGLAMTYGFVKQSGGHVEIASELDQGTTVTLYLPRSAHAGEQLADEAPTAGRPARSRSGRTIMLVEDDELVRGYARDQLAALGYNVLEAHDGPQALCLLDAAGPVDLLFTDVVMPGMSGRELVDLARAKCPDLPVLYTSAYAQDAIVHGGKLDAGVQLLSKPYRRDDLARRIRAVLPE